MTIVASQQAGLDAAVAELQPIVKSGQSLIALQADLTDEAKAVAIFHDAVAKQGNVPEYVFCCAGTLALAMIWNISRFQFLSS